ncbi:PREDICTED: ferritin, heavy subunit-like isoform X2 [Nicrophorus vespilloides]|uniref:Ferritin n=1 Tax=Nicrophorus vespilloides TaxID=110193 RepID=A0ABM1MZG4_NICVS|nr:PREDICTED: ferritin, heavy subunit-like isoform X2 [Nicrophorus vespilloides]
MFRLVFKQLISQQINHCCTNSCSPRHLFHEDCERAINNQIIAELNAAYAYLSMAAYFGRTDVALPGCEGFFNAMQVEELQHAQKLIKYQNLRGGKVLLCPLTCSDCTEWGISKSLSVGLEMEKLIKEKLISVHEVAETHNDLNLMDMIVTDFINEQERSICEFGRWLSRYGSLQGNCSGCGCVDFLFDKEIHKTYVKSDPTSEKTYK